MSTESEQVEESEGTEAPSGSFQVLQELRKDYKDPNLLPSLLELIASGDIIPEADSYFAETLKECIRPFEKRNIFLQIKNSALGQQLSRNRKTDTFEKKYLKGKVKINTQNIINGFSFYKLSDDASVVSRIQEIYNNPLDWEKRYLTLNYFLALKSRMQEKMQGMSKKAMGMVEQHEKAGGVHEANKVRSSVKKAIQNSRSKVMTTNFILFLHAALPMAYGNVSEHFAYQTVLTYRDFIRSLRSCVDIIAQHAEQLLNYESDGVERRIEQKKEKLITEAQGGKKFQKLRLNEMEKINEIVQKEKEELASHLEAMITRLNKVKIQAFYLKNLETSILSPKKPKAVFDDHLTLPQKTFKELEKLPHNDIDAKAEEYIEDICIGICRCTSIILLHEHFKKTLEMIAGKYGQVWPIIYANMMLEAQVLMNKKVMYEAKKVYATPDQSTQVLMAEKNQVTQGCTQLLQFINTIEGQANATEQFGRTKVEFYLDKAILLKKLITEVYSLLDVPAEVKIKHVEKGVSAVKSAEKAITKVMEKDSKYDAKIDENGRNALISSLYSMSSLMILGDDDDDDDMKVSA